MSPNLHQYLYIEVRIMTLDDMGADDAADQLRLESEYVWYSLTQEEKDWLNS